VTASDGKLFGEVFVTLFVIMDPPGTIPLFLSLSSGRSSAMRKRLAAQAVLVAFVVIVVFALFGQTILSYLGITLPALQAAGGLLLLLVALELLTGQADEPTETANVNVALGIVAVHIVLWLFMRFSVVIIRVIKESGVILITRIAGLLLSAIAVQLVADAVTAFVKEA